jgi:hypothetical protein
MVTTISISTLSLSLCSVYPHILRYRCILCHTQFHNKWHVPDQLKHETKMNWQQTGYFPLRPVLIFY